MEDPVTSRPYRRTFFTNSCTSLKKCWSWLVEKVVCDRERVSGWDTVEPVVDVDAVAVAVVTAAAAPPPACGLLSRDLSPGEPGAAPRRTWRSRLVRKEFCGTHKLCESLKPQPFLCEFHTLCPDN